MKRSIFKPIAMGLLFGTAAFFAPFMILKCILFFMIIGSIIKLIFWGRFRGRNGQQYYLAYADKIRGMSEEEYGNFKNKVNDKRGYCCNYYDNYNCKEKETTN